MDAKKLDTLTHQQFAERSHLIRWCHDLTTKELKALKKAYDSMRAMSKGGTK